MSDSQRWMVIGGVMAGGLLVYLLQPILAPFLLGGALAYLGDPLVDRLERLHLGRTSAVALVFVLLFGGIAALLLLLLPLLHDQVAYLQAHVPEIVRWLQQQALPWLQRRLGVQLGSAPMESLGGALAGALGSNGAVAGMLVQRLSRSGLALVEWVVNLTLVPVVTFYLLRDWDRLVASIRDLLPRRIEPAATRLARDCDEVLGAFVRGQLLVMICLGVYYWLGLTLVGLRLALLIGLLSGLASIVPYLGFALGILAASVAAFFQHQALLPVVLVWAVYAVGQALEGMVLTPLLVGDRIGVHPVAVIFAVLAGGQLFGFAGILLALPAAAVIMVGLRHAHERYKTSHLYGRD
ncbi:MAG TPA: AI-2E family transporter [Gammaproteobacteria bacterium]|nr:AI-2E family transporter [Gammaproteobacteria bacterium]